MALTAGYEHAKGDSIITIDADLQDPRKLSRKWLKSGKRDPR